eukprot:859882-Rhodomonas_salina.2
MKRAGPSHAAQGASHVAQGASHAARVGRVCSGSVECAADRTGSAQRVAGVRTSHHSSDHPTMQARSRLHALNRT